MAKGNAALEKGDFKEVERIQKLLEKKGETQAAYLLHGKSLVYAGEASLNKAPSPPPFEETQQACQMVMGSAGLDFQAVGSGSAHTDCAGGRRKIDVAERAGDDL